jgi:hypothetical protein
LHVAALVIEGHSELAAFGAIVAVAVPVLAFTIIVFLLYAYVVRQRDPFHMWLFAGTVVLLALAITLAAFGASLGLCLILVTLAPAVIVVGYETIGWRHQAARLAQLLD